MHPRDNLQIKLLSLIALTAIIVSSGAAHLPLSREIVERERTIRALQVEIQREFDREPALRANLVERTTPQALRDLVASIVSEKPSLAALSTSLGFDAPRTVVVAMETATSMAANHAVASGRDGRQILVRLPPARPRSTMLADARPSDESVDALDVAMSTAAIMVADGGLTEAR